MQPIQIPMDERTASDQDFFSALNLTLPGLKPVKSALDANDINLAKKELVHYYESRKSPQFFYDYRTLPLKPIDTDSNTHIFQSSLGLSGSLKDFCLYAAQQLMQNVYVRPGRDRVTLDLGPNYENLPHFNFYEDQQTKHRSLSDIFVRGQIFEYLAVYYHETGDAKILDKFEEVLQVFFQNYPLVLEYTKADASRFCLTEDRDVMSTGWLSLTYISLLYTRIPYEINPLLAFEIIKRIWFLGIQFRRFDNDTYRKFNHHMWERGLVPYMLALLFPEIPDFSIMKEKGIQVVCEHIMDDFNEAGGYSEHSIPYWSGAALCEMIYRGINLAQVNKEIFLHEEAKKRIHLTFQALALISPPQTLYSSIGDNGGPMVDPILEIGVQATGDPYCEEVLKLRHSNELLLPEHTPLDYCNDVCGFFATRNNYSPSANFVLMSAKVNCGNTGHNHMDMLSLCISFRGQEFVGEPHARPLYHKACLGSDERGYLYNMESHNTVLAYGRPVQPNEVYADKWGVYRPDSPVTAFTSCEDGCYVRAYHDGYTFCRHTRSLLFHRQGALIIRDEIGHGNRLPSPHIQRFHLLADVTCTSIRDNALVLEKEQVTLLFLWNRISSIRIWKKEDLYPAIIPDKSQLSTIVDVSFCDDSDEDDISTISVPLLILDITGKNLEGLDLAQLSSALDNIISEKDVAAALSRLKTII